MVLNDDSYGKFSSKFFFDSANRSSGTNANPTFVLPNRNYNVKSYRVDKITVPFSYYVINSTQGNEVDFDDGAVKVATIVAGNYDGNSLATALQTALNTTGAGFTVTFSSVTGKFTISNAVNFSLLFSTGANITAWLRSVLGFSATDLAGTNTYTSDLVALVTGPNYLLVQSVETIDGGPTPRILSTTSTTTLDMIQVTADPFGIIQYQNESDFRAKRQNSSQQPIQITFNLTFGDGTAVDLNGLSWQIVIELYYDLLSY